MIDKFKQLCAFGDDLYALDENGAVWRLSKSLVRVAGEVGHMARDYAWDYWEPVPHDTRLDHDERFQRAKERKGPATPYRGDR